MVIVGCDEFACQQSRRKATAATFVGLRLDVAANRARTPAEFLLTGDSRNEYDGRCQICIKSRTD